MAVDPEARRQRRIEMFRQVAADRIGKLNLLWIDIERTAGDPAPFLREAHTLKGEASLTGFTLASKLVHAVEDYVKLVRDRGTPPGERDGDLILGGLDLVSRMTQADPDAPSSIRGDAEAFMGRIAELLGKPIDATPGPVMVTPTPIPYVPSGELPVNLPGPASTPGVVPAMTASTGAVPEAPAAGVRDSGVVVAAVEHESSISKATQAGTTRRESSIRVTAEKIDHLRGMVSDLLLSNVRWRQLTRAARRLRESAQAIKYGRAPSSDEHAEIVNGIVSGLSDMESRLRDETHDLERLIGDLDSTTRDLRMIPLATLLDHFPVPLRLLARSLGRQVRFEMLGEQVEVDKALLEMLEEPLLHLLRNAIDHGVEPPDARVRAGKPPEATVRIVAGMVGQRLHLEVSDDGGGIDVDAVRARALKTGLLDPVLAKDATRDDILQTIFAAGFSTREQVSEVSGRGIGLNIVLDVVENVGGKIAVRTEIGRGTTFDIEVPITVAITRVVLFRVGMGTYALPASSVRSLVEASTVEQAEGPDGPVVLYAGGNVPVLDLRTVLDESRAEGANARIVIAQSGADLVALTGTTGHVEREVMMKPMGRFFEKLSLVAAAVNLEEGALALVLKAAELVLLSRMKTFKKAVAAQTAEAHAAGRVALVADDSPVVRDIIAQALRSYGLHVLVAGDGEEALAVYGTQPRVDIVVTDIDMPRLDGLGLVRALRSRRGSQDVPVVAVSMRGSEREKRAAMEAGVSAYIDKSDFNQALLWQTIRPFVLGSS